MIRTNARAKGGAQQLGAQQPGEPGPFGVRDDDGDQAEPDVPEPSDRDAELLAAVATAAEQRTQAARERFRQRREAAAERREQLWLQRQRGVAARHASKLRNLTDDDGERTAR